MQPDCFYFEFLPEDEVSWNIRRRTYDVMEFICADLKHSPHPAVLWLRPISPELASDILRRWMQNPENLIPGKRTPTKSLNHDLKGGYTPRAFPNEIWLRNDLSAPYLEYAVAHEIRHVWQKSKDMSIFDDPCRAEGDAYPFGYEVLKRFLASKGELTPEFKAEIDKKDDEARATFQARWPSGVYEIITNI
jgi:hypothetical protein